MNVRKPTDYSTLFAALDTLMAANLPQMKLYCEIGRLVSHRPEKGAAVAAAEYLQSTYPDAAGFSPRNLRRMRNLYRTYESAPEVMAKAILSNRAHPERGQAAIPFPIPDSEYDQTIGMLEGMGIGDAIRQDCRVDELDSLYPILNRLTGQSVSVDELDFVGASSIGEDAPCGEGPMFHRHTLVRVAYTRGGVAGGLGKRPNVDGALGGVVAVKFLFHGGFR